MQSVSSRIWTRVAVSISYDDNHYTTGMCVDRQAKTDLHPFRADTGCSLEYLPGGMDERDGWWEERERERESQRTPCYFWLDDENDEK